MADPLDAALALWAVWSLIWAALARSAARARRTESLYERLSHALPTVLALWLIFSPRLFAQHPAALGAAPRWAGVGLAAAGFALAVWARLHLGREWSGAVALKEGHRLVRSGPYARLRHPIYAGFLAAVLGSAAASGRLPAMLGALLLIPVYRRKARREEILLRGEFGADYEDYARQAGFLLPKSSRRPH